MLGLGDSSDKSQCQWWRRSSQPWLPQDAVCTEAFNRDYPENITNDVCDLCSGPQVSNMGFIFECPGIWDDLHKTA